MVSHWSSQAYRGQKVTLFRLIGVAMCSLPLSHPQYARDASSRHDRMTVRHRLPLCIKKALKVIQCPQFLN